MALDDHSHVQASFVVTPVVEVTPTSGLTTTEAGGTASFDMQLTTQPGDDVTVAISSSNPGEGSVSPATVTFTPADWDQPHTVTITGQDDDIDDGDISYSIVTAATVSSDPNYSGLDPADVSTSNSDDDTAGITITPLTGLVTTEAGGTASFTVVLDSLPLENVTLPLSSSDAGEGSIDKTLLSFTPQNGKTAQTVTVTGIDDQVIDGNMTYAIVTGLSDSLDPLYDEIASGDIGVSNTDNDSAIVHVSPQSGLLTSETGSSSAFEVWLETFPTHAVILNLSSSDLSEATVSPASLSFLPGDATTHQTVTVTGVNDNRDDGDIAFLVITAAAVSDDLHYSGLAVADISGSNQDDDVDTDSDTVIDPLDNCPAIANPGQMDVDFDGDGDACDTDDDNDTVLDDNDNCPSDANPAQKDTDQDSLGDACDADVDNDGIDNASDVDPYSPDICIDSDADSCDDCSMGVDGLGPAADADPFNDGPDNEADGLCDAGDPDDDNDGVLDAAPDFDNCQFVANADQADENNNGVGDLCEAPYTDQSLCLPIRAAAGKFALICL